MRKLASMLAVFALACASGAKAQSTGPSRVGVVFEGGTAYQEMLEGFKDGLRELGLEEGRSYVLEIRNVQGDLRAVPEAARALERARVRLIYSMATSVTVAVKEVPIVFAVGRDPVKAGLAESFAKPGGRLTGIHFLSTDLTAKRLELLNTVMPDLRRAVTVYNPDNSTAQDSVQLAREAARQLQVELLERHVSSPETLHQALLAIKPGEADAVFYTNDAMVASLSKTVIDIARSKRLPAGVPVAEHREGRCTVDLRRELPGIGAPFGQVRSAGPCGNAAARPAGGVVHQAQLRDRPQGRS